MISEFVEIRAQQEANKDLSQEEKQRLRKLKNEEKKAMKQAKMAKKNGENQQTEGITRLTGFRFRKTATTTTTTTTINKRWYSLHSIFIP